MANVAPVWETPGNGASTSGADLTCTMPTHAAGDILIIAAVSLDNQAHTIGTATGWAELRQGNIRTSSPLARCSFWWKRAASSSETAPVVVRSTKTAVVSARVFRISGVPPGITTPYVLSALNISGTAGSSLGSATASVTTAIDASLVVHLIAGQYATNNSANSYTATSGTPQTELTSYTGGSSTNRSLITGAYDPLPSAGAAGTTNGTFQRATTVAGAIQIAFPPPQQPTATLQGLVGETVAKTASLQGFIGPVTTEKTASLQGSIRPAVGEFGIDAGWPGTHHGEYTDDGGFGPLQFSSDLPGWKTIILCVTASAWAGADYPLTVSSPNLTWNRRGAEAGTGANRAAIFYATTTSDLTGEQITVDTTTNDYLHFIKAQLLSVENCIGLGADTESEGSGTPSLVLNATASGSILIFAGTADWSGTGERSPDASATELYGSYGASGSRGSWLYRETDPTSGSGNVTLGTTGHSTNDWAMKAVELLAGQTPGEPVEKTASLQGLISNPWPEPGVWTDVTPSFISKNPDSPAGNYGMQMVLADPARPGEFYAFTCFQGVLKSIDYGLNFELISTQMGGKQWGAAIDKNANRNPDTPPTIYCTDGNSSDLGVKKSTDGGVTWTRVFDNAKAVGVQWPADTDVVVGSFYKNDTAPVKYYRCITAGRTAGSGGPTGTGADITDNEAHWAYVGTQAAMTCPGSGTNQIDKYGVDVDPNDVNHVVVTHHEGAGTGLIESFDGGGTWIFHAGGGGGSAYCYMVTNVLWISIDQDGGVYRTTTGGWTAGAPNTNAWATVASFAHAHGCNQLFADENGILYLPGSNGINRSDDDGATWDVVYAGEENAVYATPQYMYSDYGWANAGTVDQTGKLRRSAITDGLTWEDYYPTPPAGMTNGSFHSAYTHDPVHGFNAIVSCRWLAGIWLYVEEPTHVTVEATLQGFVGTRAEKTASLSSLVAALAEHTSSLAGIVAAIATKDATLAGVVASRTETTATLQGAIVARLEKIASLQGEIASRIEKTATLEGSIVARIEKTATLLGSIVARIEKTASLQGSIIGTNLQTATLQGLVALRTEKTASVGGQVALRTEKLATVLGQIAARAEKTSSMAGLVALRNELAATLQGYIGGAAGPVEHAATLQAIVASRLLSNATLQGLVALRTEKSGTAQGLVAVRSEHLATLLGLIMGVQLRTATLAGLIQGTILRTATLAGYVADAGQVVTLKSWDGSTWADDIRAWNGADWS